MAGTFFVIAVGPHIIVPIQGVVIVNDTSWRFSLKIMTGQTSLKLSFHILDLENAITFVGDGVNLGDGLIPAGDPVWLITGEL
jgi:hypothetical protein